MKTRFFKPNKIIWITFGIFVAILILGASHRAASFDEANNRQLNRFYASLPDFMHSLPLWEFWVYTIAPIVIMLGGNIWFYGGSQESALLIQETFFVTFNLVYYYVISCSISYVIHKRKHQDDGWKNKKRNNKILLIVSITYPVFLLLLGIYGFFFVSNDVGYAPSPQESFFFVLTTLGSMSAMIFFIVIGIIYWAKNQKPKAHITVIPFAVFLLILLSLLTGFLPRGANA